MGEHYSELSALIRRVRNRWRAASALRAWSVAAAAAALVLGLALSVQSLINPTGGALVALWAVATMAALTCLGWFLAPLRRGPAAHQVARYIEECCPELDDALVTAIVHGRAGRSAMHDAVAADAVRRTRDLDLDRIVSGRTLRLAALRAAAATLALCIAAGFAFAPSARAAGVLALYLFPSRFALEIVPGDVRVRDGDAVRIAVRIPGAIAGVVPVLRAGNGDHWRDTRMDAAADGFVTRFERVTESFRYTVAAAGASSREYAVTVIRQPRVEQIDLRYEYPAAFRMAPRQEEDGGDIYGPAGTRVRVVVHADKPVTSAALTLAGGQRIALTASEAGLEGDLTILEDGSYRVALADEDGLSNPGETEYFIRTLDDRPPDVRIMRPATDRHVTPIEEVPIEARAEDDFGVAALDLVYAVRGAAPKTVPFRREGTATSVSGTRTIYLEDLDVKPGDFVTYYARARDVSRGKRSTEARSDIFFLEVTPFEEQFVAAQGQGGGSSGDAGVDDMVQAEKDIITATWKLDTRGQQAGGRSADDIRTVARAQRDLRTRALASAAQMQRANNLRRGGRLGGRGGAPAPADATADAMDKAAEAMALSSLELEMLKTTGALPHEMTALNELLRAQSESRRTQVQQQANGSGRGSNRQQQDLSSLFDRELARQQQTNYETPTSSETHGDKANEPDQALEKIRELARRQDELNKQQEQAAKKQGASDEDARRQLERLTREQSELRRQAEELAHQLQQQSQATQSQGQSQSRQRGQGGQPGAAGESGRGGQGSQAQQGGRGGAADQNRQQASRDLKQISEDMQGAASELRRDNPQQASERGSRAAERLRDLEQRMRGAQPDDRRRALGELQLESRQLADAQRALAGGAGSGRGRGDDADAARRRAAEQERLADRTARLEQSLRQMAGAASGGDEREKSALAEAARDMDRQRLSDRMRTAARAERQAGEGRAGQQPAGIAIASALDRIAERLGSAYGRNQASQQLSEELLRIRELREKLTALDRQLAELKARGAGRGGQAQAGASGTPSNPQGGRAQRGALVQNGDSTDPWEQARELLGELRDEKAARTESPAAEGFDPGRSAPGTEGWKQDFTKWDLLKTQIAAALERAESSAAARLREQQSNDHLSAGGTQAVPEQYRRLVDKYYEALAATRERR